MRLPLGPFLMSIFLRRARNRPIARLRSGNCCLFNSRKKCHDNKRAGLAGERRVKVMTLELRDE